jgi:hypothetical protein
LTRSQLRKFDIEYEIDQLDISHITRHLAITSQAARSLLVNQNRLAVRAQIERGDIPVRIMQTQRPKQAD